MKDKVTVVIPTFHRPREVQVRAQAWSDLNVDVVVADGDASATTVLDNSIQHLKSSEGFVLRLLIAMDSVKTKYVALHPDDDYFSPLAVEKSLSLMEHTKKDFCYGKTMELVKVKGWSRLFPMYERSWSKTYPNALLSSHISPRSKSTTRSSGPEYEGVFLFGIYSKSLLRKNLELGLQFEPRCYGGFEIFNAMLIVAGEEAIFSGEALWVRDTSHPSISGTKDSWDRGLGLREWFDENFEDWLALLLTELIATNHHVINKFGTRDTSLFIRSFFSSFLAKSEPSSLSKRFHHLRRVLTSRPSESVPGLPGIFY